MNDFWEPLYQNGEFKVVIHVLIVVEFLLVLIDCPVNRKECFVECAPDEAKYLGF